MMRTIQSNIEEPRLETLRNTLKLLMIYNGRFQRERMNHTLKTARLNRSAARMSCVMFGRPLRLPPAARRQSVTGYCQ